MQNKKIRIGVIPAAGAGKRMGYLGQVLLKTMFPLEDKPIIRHIVDKMGEVGIKEVYIIVHYQKEKIMEYFKEVEKDLVPKIHFIYQSELNGIANAILLTEKHIKEPFLVSLGDDVTITKSLSNLVDMFYSNNALVVEGVVKEDKKEVMQRTNCLELSNEGKILRIIEKPKEPITNLRGCGLYIFHQDIFNYIKKTPTSKIRNEVEITDTIDLAAKEGKAYGAMINGTNININTMDDLLEAWVKLKQLREN